MPSTENSTWRLPQEVTCLVLRCLDSSKFQRKGVVDELQFYSQDVCIAVCVSVVGIRSFCRRISDARGGERFGAPGNKRNSETELGRKAGQRKGRNHACGHSQRADLCLRAR